MKLKSSIENTNHFMKIAFTEAIKAKNRDEVPVGSVIVDERNNIIASNGNRIIELSDPTAHAEILCIREASKKIQSERLVNCSLFSTLEPCAMCAGAMVLARLPRLVYATTDPKAGAGGSIMDIIQHTALNHQVDVSHGLFADEASEQIRSFFRMLRARGEK